MPSCVACTGVARRGGRARSVPDGYLVGEGGGKSQPGTFARPAGTMVTFFIDGQRIGEAVVDRRGRAELEVDVSPARSR